MAALRRPCLIAFDAFGTLFSPRAPISKQYMEVASAFLAEKYPAAKLPAMDEEAVQLRFTETYKQLSKTFPNYGKKARMNPTTWWYTLIQTTLHPFVKDVVQPVDWAPLSDRLWAQFSSSKGYAMHEDSRTLINHLKKLNANNIQFIVGVVSNSDPRVSKVLSSMGLKVPSYGTGSSLSEDNDFQFIVSSYDAGVAKPDKQIFEFAESTTRKLLSLPDKEEPLLKIYIGDDFNKDGIAAIQAGWNSILVDRSDDEMTRQHFPASQVLEYRPDVDSKGPPLHMERVRSLWPFQPQILSDFKEFDRQGQLCK